MGIQDAADEAFPVICLIPFAESWLFWVSEIITPSGNGDSPSRCDHKLQVSAHLVKTVTHAGGSWLFFEGDFAFLKAGFLYTVKTASCLLVC